MAEAARSVETLKPQTLRASDADVQLARNAEPIEQKPAVATRQDLDAFAKVVDVADRGRDESRDANGANRLRPHDDEFGGGRQWDGKVRQWDRNWIDYDQYYRPLIFNPFRDPVRIVYVYQDAPRIAIIPPLARIVLNVAQFAAYSFTAVVLNTVNTAANLINTAVDFVSTAANVAVGSFFGGGFVPNLGLPLPAAPPPVLRYDNVPVQVRYSQADYEPFRVRQIVDVGDDVRYGGRKVLLDGATPAWGEWTQSPSGERQFEVHRTQQFPGLGEPQEAPLPGDYQMRLLSDESSASDRHQVMLVTAAAVLIVLSFSAIGLAVLLGRRRPQH